MSTTIKVFSWILGKDLVYIYIYIYWVKILNLHILDI